MSPKCHTIFHNLNDDLRCLFLIHSLMNFSSYVPSFTFCGCIYRVYFRVLTTLFAKKSVSIDSCSFPGLFSSLGGVAKVWSMPEVKKISALKGHTERATDVAFSPINNHVATASADRTARLWNSDGSALRTYGGHLDRLARIAFHPSGKYLGTASFDKTWRLWDVETGEELLLQEGHSRSVYGISFHHDGSLVASCGLDSLARVWDLRSGRSILAFEGHVKPVMLYYIHFDSSLIFCRLEFSAGFWVLDSCLFQVLSADFSPNGYHLATGGEDNTCRIWDLRKRKTLYIIPAHANLVSQVKFEPQDGYFLVTASYDMTAKVCFVYVSHTCLNYFLLYVTILIPVPCFSFQIWSARDFKPVKTLSGHEAKVTSLDIIGGQLDRFYLLCQDYFPW